VTVVRSAVATHSHLFPGARVDLGGGSGAASELRLRFSDGVEVDAELVELDGGDLALAVPGYVTAAGTAIHARVWLVRLADDAPSRTLTVRSRTDLR